MEEVTTTLDDIELVDSTGITSEQVKDEINQVYIPKVLRRRMHLLNQVQVCI